MQSYIGKQIDRYRIIKRLGTGGMAVVYKAVDTLLEREVAIKLIRSGAIAEDQYTDVIRRFQREARSQAQFNHPNIVRVLDYGEVDGSPYLVMEFIKGGTLKDRIRKETITWRQAVSWILQIAKALNYAHQRGVIHRDVKPSNILFDLGGKPILTDFGIAKILELDDDTLTATGFGVGTPEYMAPEQWQGKVSEASDQYALGVVLYELVTGKKPYEADTPAMLAIMQATEPILAPNKIVRGVPFEVEKILYKVLAFNQEDRYQNLDDFAYSLSRLLSEPRIIDEDSSNEGLSRKFLEVSASDLVGGKTTLTRESKKFINQHNAVNEKDNKALSKWAFRITFSIILIVGLSLSIGIGIKIKKPGSENTSSSQGGIRPTDTRTQHVQITSTISPTKSVTATITPELTFTPTLVKVEYRLREIDGMMQVYVPAGEYPMGYSAEQIELLSQICEEHKSSLEDYGSTDCSFISFIEAKDESVYTDGFWIDQTEVTNSMYEKCRLSGACPSFLKRSFTRQVYSRDPQFADFPMMYAYLEEAHAYCEWVGGRLPIFTEWKMAALGTDGRLFPWGNSAPSDELLNYYGSKIGDSVAVGSYPNGKSPYGALDLLGNVSEWLSDSECFVDDEFQWEWCGYVGGDARDGFNRIFFRPTFDQPGGSTGQGFRCVNEP